MPISRYPRHGEPIVPHLINNLLKEAGVNGFHGLDTTVWSRLGEAKCRRHARRFLTTMEALGKSFFAKFADQPLSQQEAMIPVGELELERRTLNCLVNRKLDAILTGPNGLTVGDVLGFKGFGTKCLVDLAASIEAAVGSQSGRKRAAARRTKETRQKPKPHVENVRLAEGEAVIAKLATIPGALAVTPRDPRLGSQLQSVAPGAPTLEAALELFRRVGLPPVAAREMKRLLSTIRTISRAKVEDEVFAVMAAGHDQRNRELIAACLQWRGKRRPSYGSVGKQFGITHERVRQVFRKKQKAWAKEPPFAPALDRALAVLQAATPTRAADVEQQLALARLFNEAISLKRLHDFAELLGRKPGFVVFSAAGQLSVASEADAVTLSHLQRRARKLVSNHGLATVAQVTRPWQDAPNLSQCLNYALQTLPDFVWIDEATGVFSRLIPERNKLWTRIRKVLSVAPRVKVDVLWDAVRRDPRFPSDQLTKEQLLSFCRRHPECRVVGSTVIARQPQSLSDAFQGHERILVNLLLQRGPLPKRELYRLATEAGMGRPSFERSLMSPAIMRLTSSVYGVVGQSQ